MASNKPKVIKDYEKMSPEHIEQIKLIYPEGFKQFLIEFTNHKGEIVSALPFETDEKIYMIRMSKRIAAQIIELDDDYDDDGMLKDDVRNDYEEKYSDD